MGKRYAPPTGGLIDSIASRNHGMLTLLGELIDNALDANAQDISIEFRRDRVIITDDGRGAPDLIPMVQIGEHRKYSTTRLGRFGIGGKEAVLVLGGGDGNVEISSIHDGIERQFNVNWRDYSLSNWELDDPTERVASPHQRGTIITVQPVKKRVPSGDDWKRLLNDLGYLFSAALKGNKRIIRIKRSDRNWEPVVRWELPRFEGEVLDVDIVVGTRKATGWMMIGARSSSHSFRACSTPPTMAANMVAGRPLMAPYGPLRADEYVDQPYSVALGKAILAA